MSYAYLKPGKARLLFLAVEHDLPLKAAEWKKELAQNRMTTEMRAVFNAMGYEVPRARRPKDETEEVTVEDINAREAEARDGMHQPETGPVYTAEELSLE